VPNLKRYYDICYVHKVVELFALANDELHMPICILKCGVNKKIIIELHEPKLKTFTLMVLKVLMVLPSFEGVFYIYRPLKGNKTHLLLT
jgi:hypothetical protein